jgi:hypothetical protein
MVNPIADILPLRGISKPVIANEEAATAAWPSTQLVPLIPGICIINAFESVVIAPSDTV